MNKKSLKLTICKSAHQKKSSESGQENLRVSPTPFNDYACVDLYSALIRANVPFKGALQQRKKMGLHF
jgi:hypothetical protein